MLGLFIKPLEQLSGQDLDELVADGFPEGTRVEYKRELPARKGQDPWYEGGKLSEYARRRIIAEVVAMANAHGGHVLLGVDETEDKPPRAAGVRCVPRCHELAEVLRLQIRDCVDPQIPLVNTCGVVTEEDGGGVVVVRVERSYLAPHRLKDDLQCYYRRADRTEPMSMREIQDLTLRMERGTERVEHVLSQRSTRLHNWAMRHGTEPQAGPAFAFRASAVPVWPIELPRITDDVFPEVRRSFELRVGGRKTEIFLRSMPHIKRPILRGMERRNSSETFIMTQEMFAHGLCEVCATVMATDERRQVIYPAWLLGAAANVLLMADTFRQAAGAPEAEFVLEVEVASALMSSLRVGGLFGDTTSDPYLPEVMPAHCLFPRLSVGPRLEFSSLMKVLTNDILNAGGTDTLDEEFELVM